MASKVTFYFSTGRYTWSEAHVMTLSGIPTAIQAEAIRYANMRVPCLGNAASLEAIRISEIPASRLVDDVDEAAYPHVPTWPADPTGLSYTTDRAYSALLIQLKGGLSDRNFYMSGVPDGLIDNFGDPVKGFSWVGAPAAQTRFLTFLNYLTSGAGWGYQATRFSALTQAAGAPVTLNLYPGMVGIPTQAPLAGVILGSQVLMRGWRRNNVRLAGLSGFYQVAAIVPPTAPASTPYTYFLSRTGNVSPTNFETVGQIGLATPQLEVYTNYSFIRAVKRSRGGSYGLPRGRSRTRA